MTLTSKRFLFTLLLFIFCSAPLANSKATNSKTTISHAITMEGEPKYSEGFAGFDYTSAKATKGGEIHFYDLGTFDSLNQFIAKGNPEGKLGLIYDTLMVQSYDEIMTQYGLVAKHVELPEDRSWIVYHLNKEAKFHDGHMIDAEDVVFSFNILTEKGSPIYKQIYTDVASVEAIEKHKVKFTFANTTNRELPIIVGSLPVLPQHYWQDKKFDETSLDIPLGSGPYKIEKIDPGRSIVYSRVKNYWAAKHPTNRGMYNFDNIAIDYYKDFNVALEALKAGEYDAKIENVSKFWASAYTGPAIEKGWLKKEEIPDLSPQPTQGYMFNLKRPLLQDKQLRIAMAYAFDFEWTNKNIFFGAYTRTSSYFTNTELESSGLPEGEELKILNKFKDQLPEQIFTEEFRLPVTDGSGNNRKNLITAQNILKEAGYKFEKGILISPTTKEPVKIEMLIYDSTSERILNNYVTNLKRLGIELNIRKVDTSQYINKLLAKDFDLFTHIFGTSIWPGNEQRDYWGSEAADIDGSRNYAGVKNPVVDALIDMIVDAPSRQDLVFRTRALDRVLLNEFYMIPQWYVANHRVAYWDKFDRPEVIAKYDGNYSLTFMTWWYNPEKAARIKN